MNGTLQSKVSTFQEEYEAKTLDGNYIEQKTISKDLVMAHRRTIKLFQSE